jgi:hypothetical protein
MGTGLMTLILFERLIVLNRFISDEYHNKGEFLCMLFIPFAPIMWDAICAFKYITFITQRTGLSFIELLKERFNKLR